MSASDDSKSVMRLRREFDDAFALPPEPPAGDRIAFVVVRIADEMHAVASNALRKITRCPSVTAIPSRATALRGIAALRGSIVGVYELDALLRGHVAGTTGGDWLLLCPDGETALAVDAIVGQVHAMPGDVLPIAEAEQDALVRAVLDLGARSYPLIDLPSVLRRVGAAEEPGNAGRRPPWRE